MKTTALAGTKKLIDSSAEKIAESTFRNTKKTFSLKKMLINFFSF